MGVAIGIVLAAILGRLLSGILYEVKPLDPVVFVTAPLSCSWSPRSWRPGFPARRATRVTPLTALK